MVLKQSRSSTKEEVIGEDKNVVIGFGGNYFPRQRK